MLITRLEKVSKSKVRVYIDGDYGFFLHQKDMERYQLMEDEEIQMSLYEEIIEDIVLPRAKQKALSLLKVMDHTEAELRRKLSRNEYPSFVIDQVIYYVSEYGYLNDERYASAYIRAKMGSTSKRMIQMKLSEKGISKELFDRIYQEEHEELEEDPEIKAIKKLIDKRTKGLPCETMEEKQKIMAYLFRKGFPTEKIRQCLQ